MGKQLDSRAPAGVYRDDPDRDDAASTSSAVPMGDMEYPDSDLPAYEDVPATMGPTESHYPETQSYLGLEILVSSCDSANKSLKIPHSSCASPLSPLPRRDYNNNPLSTLQPGCYYSWQDDQGSVEIPSYVHHSNRRNTHRD